MTRVFVKFVVLNLHEVALAGGLLPSLEVGSKSLFSTINALLLGCGIKNYTGPVLCDAYSERGCIEIVYRVRTSSRSLSSNLNWHDTRYESRESPTIDRVMCAEKP